MTMLKTFDLKGNKQSFAEWISNLSPCETPFISMINKEATDQVQYSWQTDALGAAKNDAIVEGSAAVAVKPASTSVKTNFTQIFRKAVRVSDTTKKIGLYGRASELAYQMEKAGMEIKRDLESHLLNSREAGRPGTTMNHGIVGGVYGMVAGVNIKDVGTDAVVHKVVQYAAGAHNKKFTQVQVFDLTYNLYLAGSRANKVMVHPMNMYLFSDWIGDSTVTPHVHRMFDGMDEKFNAHVSKFRDPLGQEFEIIPNRYMAKNQLFFFHDADWTQMILRAPEQSELGKTGSAEKHMIEMEVGLRHRNPFASGILEFNAAAFAQISEVVVSPPQVLAGTEAINESTITVTFKQADGSASTTHGAATVRAVVMNDDGTTSTESTTAGSTTTGGKSTVKIKSPKGARIKAKVYESTASNFSESKDVDVLVDVYESRD
ncbi:MAG: SU10 major capsid protein [Bacteroidales bacterium]